MAGIGHNTKTTFAHGQLQSLVDRIERVEAEKAELTASIKDLYVEAKGHGFDAKILRKIVSIRKQDAAKRAEEEALLDVYMAALGMLVDTPLGKAALDREGIKVTATRLRMEDTANLSQEMAEAGLISPKAAEETRAISQAINDKWGDGKPLEPKS